MSKSTPISLGSLTSIIIIGDNLKPIFIAFFAVITVLGGSFGVLFFQSELNTKELSVVDSTFDKKTMNLQLTIQLIATDAFEVITSSAAVFSIEIISYDDGILDGMWSIHSISAQVITTHQFPAGTSQHKFSGTLVQNFPTFAPIDPPDLLSFRIILGDNVLVSSDVSISLNK